MQSISFEGLILGPVLLIFRIWHPPGLLPRALSGKSGYTQYSTYYTHKGYISLSHLLLLTASGKGGWPGAKTQKALSQGFTVPAQSASHGPVPSRESAYYPALLGKCQAGFRIPPLQACCTGGNFSNSAGGNHLGNQGFGPPARRHTIYMACSSGVGVGRRNGWSGFPIFFPRLDLDPSPKHIPLCVSTPFPPRSEEEDGAAGGCNKSLLARVSRVTVIPD